MKRIIFAIVLMCAALTANAQHSLQVDNGAGGIGILSASGLPLGTTTFTFPTTGGILLTTLTGVTGSGVANTIPKWTAAQVIGNSAMTDNGTTLAYSGTTINLSTATTATTGYKIAGNTVFHNTGTGNIGIGLNALLAIAAGTRNVGVGEGSLRQVAGSSDNTAIGFESGHNSTGGSNTIAGTYAMRNSGASGNSVAIGYSALYSSTGSSNTAVGYNAGLINTTGANNTFVGSGATASANNFSNATAIGNGATVGATNTIQLGNGSVTLVNTSGAIMTPQLRGAGANRYAEKHTVLVGEIAGNTVTIPNTIVAGGTSVVIATLVSGTGGYVLTASAAAGSVAITFNAVPTAGDIVNYIVVNP